VPGTIQSVERAAALVRQLASRREPVGLADLALSVGLAKPTVHGLLRTLVDVGFVEQDEESGGYRLAAEVLTLGYERVGPDELRSCAINWADALAARTGLAVRLAVLDRGEALIAHHVFRPDVPGQVLETGRTLPLHASAVGKVLLAFDPAAARGLERRGLEPLTYRTLTEVPSLLRHLADVRDQGWAVALEELAPDAAEVGAPVRDGSGHVVAAVGVLVRVEDQSDAPHRPRSTVVEEVVAAGRAISRELGHGRGR
jgi:DNA-binding IclR family transcriptional regulator